MKINIQDLVSESFPIDDFQPLTHVIGKHRWDTRHGVKALNSRFRQTAFGKNLYRAMRKNQPNQIISELVFATSLTMNDMYEHRFIRADKSISTYGDIPVASICIYLNNQSKTLVMKALDSSGEQICQVKPFNKKYQPKYVTFDIYGIFLINLFRQMSLKYSVQSSKPTSFAKISRDRFIRLDRHLEKQHS